MAFTAKERPWLSAKRYGTLLRKKEDHSLFENPWKSKYMCWIHGQIFKMKQAEITLVKSGAGTKEELIVSGIEENADLGEWSLGEEPKDKRGEKFTLVHREKAALKISLKADSVEEAEEWVREIQKVLDAVDAQQPGHKPAPPPERERPKATEKREKAAPDAQQDFKKTASDEAATEKLHGRNRFVYSNKDVYDGDWVHGMKHGSGQYTRADGSVYDGEYKRDKKHGQGRCTWTNGNTYVGQWGNGAQHGHGILSCPDGRRYEGGWISGKQHGKGTFSNTEGDLYVGEWKDGAKHGKGKMTSKDGHMYEGEWENNKKNGYGKHVRPDKSSYEGMWKDDKKHGNGTYLYANGDKYKGETQNGHKHGFGVFTSANGASYSGWWRDGKKHGKGTYVSANGRKHESWWKDDKPDPTGGASQDTREDPPPTFEKAKGGGYGGPARGGAREEVKPENANKPSANGNNANNGNAKAANGGGAGWKNRGGATAGMTKEEREVHEKRQQAEEDATARADARAAERIAENERMRKACASSAVMQDLGPQLEALRKAGKVSVKALMQHVYKHHPPKNAGDFVPTDFSDAQMKKTILKTIRVYHQDKNSMEAYGLEWHLLCREITKLLNEKLELYK